MRHAIIERMKTHRRRRSVPIVYVEWFPGRTKEQKVEVKEGNAVRVEFDLR